MSGLHKSAAHGPDSDGCTVGEVKFSQNVLHVFLDRLNTDMEGTGNVLVAQSKGNMPHNLGLALRQPDVIGGDVCIHDSGDPLQGAVSRRNLAFHRRS